MILALGFTIISQTSGPTRAAPEVSADAVGESTALRPAGDGGSLGLCKHGSLSWGVLGAAVIAWE